MSPETALEALRTEPIVHAVKDTQMSLKTNQDNSVTIHVTKQPSEQQRPVLLYLPQEQLKRFLKKYKDFVVKTEKDTP